MSGEVVDEFTGTLEDEDDFEALGDGDLREQAETVDEWLGTAIELDDRERLEQFGHVILALARRPDE